MAKFTREDSLYMARRALDIEKQHQEYTIIIGGDKKFNKIKWRVFPAIISEGDVSIKEFKKFLGENIIIFTSEDISRSIENVHTIKGLDDTLYVWVNGRIQHYK